MMSRRKPPWAGSASPARVVTALLPNRTTESFQMEAGPPYDKQRIQMGLRSGNTVLIYFRSGVGTNKPWQGQHKFWKYVSPIRTYFAWLPEQLARTYCSAALDRRTVRCENEAQRALHAALLPLLRLEDRHVLATLSAVVLALCEGRTGLAISGVFGAGKTRSAAALLAGLLVFDPSLQLMVLTKENIAAHAVAEHLVSLQMPDYIQDKMGRLVGYYEQNRKGSHTEVTSHRMRRWLSTGM